MVRKRRPPQWHLILTLLALVAAIGGAIYLSHPPPAADPGPGDGPRPTPVAHAGARSFADSLYAQVDSALAELGIPKAAIAKQRPPGQLDEVRVRVPEDLPLASVNLHLTRLAVWQGGEVVRGVEVDGPAAVDLTCGFGSTATTVFHLKRDKVARRAGRIAVVVDAAGAGRSQRRLLAQLCALPQPVTLVVAPGVLDGEDAAPAGPCQLLAELPVQQGWVPLAHGEVERQLWAVAEVAADGGRAVAVARLGDDTLPALRAALPRLERRGHRFATLSDL